MNTSTTTKVIGRLLYRCLGLPAIMLGLSALAAQASFPQPTLFYDFNDPDGSTVSSVDSSGSLDFDSYIYDSNTGDPLIQPSYTAGGVGVSGFANDRALDLSDASGMGGSTNNGGGAVAEAGFDTVTGFDGAQSFTIAGFFYATESVIVSNAQLVNVSNASTDGFRLSGRTGSTGGGNLQLDYVGENERQAVESTGGRYSAVGEWVFFALTLDTTITSGDNLFFYYVNEQGEMAIADAMEFDAGAMVVGDRSPVFGNFAGSTDPATTRPFQGYLDNFALWVDPDGASGALSMAELESFYLTSIPEPAHFSSVLGLMLLCLMAFRRGSSRGL